MTVLLQVELAQVTCGICGGVYAIAERYREKKYEESGFWNCPYCQCSWGYPKDGSDNEKLRKQLTQEQARHDQTKAELRDKERQATALKGVNTRMKNRVGKGVCPCCKRFFKDLHAHMKGQHPTFAESP